MSTVIRCIYCGKDVEISEAIRHEIEDNIKQSVTEEVSKKNSLELQDLKKQLDEQKKKNDEFRQQELELREEKRKIEEEKKDLKLEIERKLDEERKKIEEKVIASEEEKQRLKSKEKDEQIDNLKRMLEEANRKASQASQQIQGEVLEVDLEEKLRQNFPSDDINGVAKGARGADIVQIVRNNFGKVSGKILWETKRAAWSPSWLPKLREDTRKEAASISVLITEELPKEIKTFGVVDGVLISAYSYALPLAFILRRQLNAIFQAKQTVENKDEKLERMYNYLQSDMFRHHIEAFVESAVADQQDLETEKRSMQRVWKKREMQIQRTIENLTNMYGELQGIMGKTLPDIRHLSLDSGEENEVNP